VYEGIPFILIYCVTATRKFRMMKMIIFTIVSLALLTLEVESTQRAELTIHEGPATFKETVVTDDKGEIEIIRTPAHNGRSAEVVLKNFKKGYRIIKFPAEKICLVLKLDKDDEKPKQLLKSIKQVGGNFRMNEYMVKHEQLLPIGPADSKSDGGKMSKKFCKGYTIHSTVAYQGNDLNAFVKKMLVEQMKDEEKINEAEVSDELVFLENEVMAEEKDPEITEAKAEEKDPEITPKKPASDKTIGKRQTSVPNTIISCTKKNANTAMTECNGDVRKLYNRCDFKAATGCTYSVDCKFDATKTHGITCSETHVYNSVFCCDWFCNQ